MTPGRTHRLCVVAFLLAALFLSACGSDDKPAAGKDAPESSSPPEPVHHPFTGVLIDEVPEHGALVVKMDNTGNSKPQAGLGSADMVVEELVEGGLTRLATVFWDTLPKEVGPVRSMRTSDIDIVKPTNGLLAASGAARRPTRAIKAAGIPTALPGGKEFSRDPQRQAPYDLMLDPRALEPRLGKLDEPNAYVAWAEPDAAAPKGRVARSAAVKFSPFHTTSWSFAGKQGWQRDEELAGDKSRFRVDNLLVLSVKVRDAGYKDVAGNPVPETVFNGKGKAWLFRDGKVVNATWSKSGADATLELSGPGGAPLPVPVGQTWIELMPSEGKVTFGR